jgi:hypothetical protein
MTVEFFLHTVLAAHLKMLEVVSDDRCTPFVSLGLFDRNLKVALATEYGTRVWRVGCRGKGEMCTC